MAFLPNGRLLVTEMKGNLFIVTQAEEKSGAISDAPDVDYGGQGGLGDTRGAAVARDESSGGSEGRLLRLTPKN